MKEKNKENLKENKKGIFQSFKVLWSFMGRKEKVYCVLILISLLFMPFLKVWQSMLPSIILSRIVDENVKVLGFIDLSMLSDIAFYVIVILSIPALWIIGMLIYRAIDIFARRMMCVANEKVQELLLEERKNLDFKMTNGEVYYIVKNAVDNIYNIIEPTFWTYIVGTLSFIAIFIQFFIFDVYVGLMAVAYFVLLLVCVLLRTKVQAKVVDRIENINGKIGNHFLMSLTNLPMITMFSSKVKELKVLSTINKEFYKENKTRANIGFWYWIIITFVEYAGVLGIILYLILTNYESLATTVTATLTMTDYIMSNVENWGYSLNDLQIASLKLCNLSKIYPEKRDLVKVEKEKVDFGKIEKLEVKDYFVKVENFEKTYNQVFKKGKIYLLSGQSGAGKTTLINAICGLREIESGNLVINDKVELKNLYNYRDRIVYLFQDSILFDRSLQENIAYPDDDLNQKAKDLIDKFNMKKLLNRKVNTSIKNVLSGGEKKRVDIIRTLSKDKEIYLFDEPTNELDSSNVSEVLEEIKNVASENKIVIIISHDNRCFDIADEIVKL